jgi:hypothetical protein
VALGRVVAALDALRQLDLLRRGQQRHAADLLEEELERVRRELGLGLGRYLHLAGRLDDRDLELVERVVERVQLASVEVEVVECACDVLGAQRSGRPAYLDQAARLVELEDVAPCCCLRLGRGRVLFRVRADAALCQKAKVSA